MTCLTSQIYDILYMCDLTLTLFLQEETHPILFQHLEMYQPSYTHQPTLPHNSGTLLKMNDAYLLLLHSVSLSWSHLQVIYHVSLF